MSQRVGWLSSLGDENWNGDRVDGEEEEEEAKIKKNSIPNVCT